MSNVCRRSPRAWEKVGGPKYALLANTDLCSFPSNDLAAGAHTNTEDSYVGYITAMIKALKLNKPIVCGASMAGQICLAVAVRAKEVGAVGTIPLQGSV